MFRQEPVYRLNLDSIVIPDNFCKFACEDIASNRQTVCALTEQHHLRHNLSVLYSIMIRICQIDHLKTIVAD